MRVTRHPLDLPPALLGRVRVSESVLATRPTRGQNVVPVDVAALGLHRVVLVHERAEGGVRARDGVRVRRPRSGALLPDRSQHVLTQGILYEPPPR